MNHTWSTLVADGWTLGVLIVVVVLALSSSIAVLVVGLRASSRIRASRRKIVAALVSQTAPGQGVDAKLIADLRDYVVVAERQPIRVVTQGLDDDALKSLSSSILDRGLGGWTQRVGDNLTALALFFTFTLLAIVLSQDVTEAIRADAGAAARNDALVAAFGKMGAKFFISAAGLLGAVLFRVMKEAARSSIATALHGLVRQDAGEFITLERYSVDVAARESAELKRAVAHGASQLEQALAPLLSMRVSVSDIGEELTTHLKSLMRESIAEEISRNISELRVTVEAISTRVEATMTEAMTRQVDAILGSLNELRDTVHERAGGEVESLLDRMKDLLSGGFQSAQGDMSSQMQSLTAQLGSLVAQVSATTQSIAGDATSRSDAMRASMEALLIRTTEVMESFQTAQVAAATSSRQSADYVRHEVAAAMQSTRDAAGELDSQSRRVEASLERILGDLEKALDRSGQMVGQFSSEVDNARQFTKVTADAANQFANGSAAIQQAAVQFDQNLRSLAASIGAQRESQDEFARIIPSSVATVQDRLSAQARELGSAWTTLQSALRTSVDAIGTSLSEPIDALGDHVASLNQSIKALNGSNGPRR